MMIPIKEVKVKVQYLRMEFFYSIMVIYYPRNLGQLNRSNCLDTYICGYKIQINEVCLQINHFFFFFYIKKVSNCRHISLGIFHMSKKHCNPQEKFQVGIDSTSKFPLQRQVQYRINVKISMFFIGCKKKKHQKKR